MKNIEQVLREKEADIERLTREIKVLRVAARLLEEDASSGAGKARVDDAVLEVAPAAVGPNGQTTNKRWP
jgi:hypothetical protein